MAELKVFNEKAIAMAGHFDVKKTYKDILGYMEDTFQYDPSVLDYDEKNQGGKREINAKAEATRNVSDGFKIKLKFTIAFEGKDVEFENDGKKIKTQKGSGKIIMNAYVIKTDSDATGFAKFLEKIRERFIAHEDVGDVMKMAGENVGAIFGRFKSNFS